MTGMPGKRLQRSKVPRTAGRAPARAAGTRGELIDPRIKLR
jgi:hypothetical protein